MSYRKYQPLPRTIYALAWKGQRKCYIGQSLDMKRRWGEHKRSGDWETLGEFEVQSLGEYKVTELEACEWEYAWRICAHLNGWKVIGGVGDTGPYVVNPNKRTNSHRQNLTRYCRWPLDTFGWRHYRLKSWWSGPLVFVAVLTIYVFGWTGLVALLLHAINFITSS